MDMFDHILSSSIFKMKEEKNNKGIDIKKIKENEIFKLCVTNYGIVNLLILFLGVNLLVGQYLYNKSNLIINILVILIGLGFYLLVKDSVKEAKQKKIGSAIFKINILIYTLLMVNDSIINVFNEILKDDKLNIATMLGMFNFGLMILYIAILNHEEVKEVFEKIEEINILAKLTGSESEEIKPGDAVLGYEVDENGKKTNKPVILPLKDRFLHMLVLGPTGCGKTSQSIIPMINRDMTNKEMGITVLEPKGDLAEKIYAMALHYDREVLYFNPILPDCPYFNPLYGKESDVVENMATTFNMLNPDSPQFFKDMSEGLIRRAVKLLKRLYDDDATLLDLNTLVLNTEGKGQQMVMEFSKIRVSNPDMQRENEEIKSWFLNDYYSGISSQKGGTKTYEHCSGVRSQISKLVSNKYLRRVLNPPKGHGSDLDFDDAFERGIIVTMGTAQGALRDLGRYLGYFIILQLQSSVFRRPGNEFTRKHNMLYIDEFQVYSNPGFADMLTMGRSYRVASHLATQARAQMGMGGGSDGKNFIELVSTNARNKIIYPGVSSTDAKYYSDEFGEILKTNKSKTYGKKRYMSTMADERVSIKVDEKLESRFTPTDIIYRPFGHITYCIIKNNSIQSPGVSQIEYIPQDLNNKLDEMVAKYNAEQSAKSEELEKLIEQGVNVNNTIPDNSNGYINSNISTNLKDPLSGNYDDPCSMNIEDAQEDNVI